MACVAPRNELEQKITNLWAEMLRVEKVGVEDNFFELGGDSILAKRMVLAVEKMTDAKVPQAYFRKPTIAHLAELLKAKAETPRSVVVDADAQHPAGQLRKAERSMRRRLRAQAIEIGPLWRGYGLPYRLGIHLQKTWLAMPAVQERLFHHDIQTLKLWIALAGEQAADIAIQKSLMTNTWLAWRIQKLKSPLGVSPWITVQGDPTFWRPQVGEPGVVLIFMHTPLLSLFHACLQSEQRECVLIYGHDVAKRSAQIYQALQILPHGGTVLTVGDGRFGNGGITLPFYEGHITFRPGAAEVALQTHARLAAVFTTLETNGQIKFEICPLHTDTSMPYATQVNALTQTYGEMVIKRWPALYTSHKLGHLRGLLARAGQTGFPRPAHWVDMPSLET